MECTSDPITPDNAVDTTTTGSWPPPAESAFQKFAKSRPGYSRAFLSPLSGPKFSAACHFTWMVVQGLSRSEALSIIGKDHAGNVEAIACDV